jgi:hypothetical protein
MSQMDVTLSDVRHVLFGPPYPRVPRKVETYLGEYQGHPLCQKPQRLLSGTISVLLDSLDDAMENPGVGPLSRKVEI